jgi:hypothetical protein
MFFGLFKSNKKAAPAAATAVAEPASTTATIPPPLPAVPAKPKKSVEIPSDKIAARAYEIWVMRGKPVGTSHQDWLDAEAELRALYAND